MEAVLTPNPGIKWRIGKSIKINEQRTNDLGFILGNRIEDFFYEKIDKKKPNRLSNLEYVGIDMIEAGNDFGPGIAYGMCVISIVNWLFLWNLLLHRFLFLYFIVGSALIKVGQSQQKLGQIERDFIGIAANCYIQPLRKFLDGEMKTVSKEMAILETKR